MSEINAEMNRHYYQAGQGKTFDKDCAGDKFWLGPFVARHEIAEYGFLEYKETDFRNGPNYGKLTGRHRFSIYINGHSLSVGAGTLDEALIVAIAHKRDGLNTQAARFFLRATNPTEETQ